jgi:hypothetical protein
MAEEAERLGYAFPYLVDESQEVAKSYRAACTPDFFLFDAARRLVCRGQFDASRPGNLIPVTGSDLRVATDAVLAGRPVPAAQTPSIGCNIKWVPGGEPEWVSSTRVRVIRNAARRAGRRSPASCTSGRPPAAPPAPSAGVSGAPDDRSRGASWSAGTPRSQARSS